MIMKVKLTRRWGPHRADKTVEVSDSQGAWLIQHNYAESSGDVVAPVQNAAAPGGHGADPLAGADATRRRPRVGRPERDARLNYAASAPGSSPTYRAGFDQEASTRQGPAGRDQLAAAAAEGTARADSAGDGADSKKTVRRRSNKSDA
jgi:hypothetical protein